MRSARHLEDLGIFGLPGDVSPWDLRFDPSDIKHLERLDGDRVRFSLWAEPDLVEAWVVLRHGDGTVIAHQMGAWSQSGRFSFWAAELEIAARCDFSFALRSVDGSPVYFVPSGVTASVERLDRWPLDPAVINHIDTPVWAQGGVIYQIFPDRFANGDTRLDPPDLDPWGSEPKPRRFQGGDLIGVADRIGYLADLGIDAIYLNPIFASPSNHRYDTVDYHQVDPALGGNEALATLVDTAHGHDIKVILDASFNHVHPRFFAFDDLIRRGRRSAYRDWFVVHDWPVRLKYRASGRGSSWMKQMIPVWAAEIGMPIEEVVGDGRMIEPTYEAWYSVPTMPRVDLAHPEARNYMLEVAARWVRDFGIDGWRMDVARYVDPDFWNDFRRVVKAVKPDAYLLAEIMGDTGNWLQGDRFDATMNYTFRSIALRYLARDTLDGAGMLDEASRLLAQYPWAVTLANQNLIGSHDTPRFLTEAGGEGWRLRLATILQLTFPGAPGIYYGDEVGLAGANDPGCRGAFPWEVDPKQHPVHRTIRQLSALRRSRVSLCTGHLVPVEGRGGLVVFERVEGRQRTVVAINRGSRAASFHASGAVKPRWGGATVVGDRVTVPARDAALLW
ncbi:MAG: alpha-amylase family glycosyl hydrolase [Acidimicrobiia bacterium]